LSNKGINFLSYTIEKRKRQKKGNAPVSMLAENLAKVARIEHSWKMDRQHFRPNEIRPVLQVKLLSAASGNV
jgi:hypothetical protein